MLGGGSARGACEQPDRNAMTSLSEAIERLNASIARLERVLEARGGRAGDAGAREALAQARRRNDELNATVQQAAERLDRAVGRVSAILER